MTISIKDAKRRKIARLARRLSHETAGTTRGAALMPKMRGLLGGWLRWFRPDNAAENEEALTKAQIALSFQPMLRAVLLAGTIYFSIIVLAHYLTKDLGGFLMLGGIAAIQAAACLALHMEFRQKTLTYHQLELRALLLFGITYLGLVAQHTYRFEPETLIYFMFLTMVVATTSVSVRVIVSAAALCIATADYFAARAGGEMLEHYAYVGLAGIMVSFCLASLMRTTITREIRARLLADTLRGSAETLSDSDMLTGLPNRRHFFRELKSSLAATGEKRHFALAIADLDGFKPINDTFGHAVGDKLLFEVAQRLKDVCGEDCFLARLGGDEFAIIVHRRCDSDSLQELGERIRNAVSQPHEIVGIKMSVGVSIGFVYENEMALVESELMERADYALYRAKETKCGVVTYSQQHEIDRRNENAIEYTLRNSDLAAEMHIAYQPQTDIRTGQTRGFEALARWSSSELGFVPPDVFIRAAERTGLMEDLTPLLLQKALSGAVDWPDGMVMSFNLSIRDIVSATSIARICNVVRDSGFPADRLEFEVTETLVMSDFKKAQKSLGTLRDLGAQVALDDFGVGYTNFEYIDELHISTVKIDRSFVSRLNEPGRSGKLIAAMIQMCDALGVDHVVEGVENERQFAVIRAAGANFVQGYYFSSPMLPEDVPVYLLREHFSLRNDGPGVRIAAS